MSIHHTLAIFINFKTFRVAKNDPEKTQQLAFLLIDIVNKQNQGIYLFID